MTLVTECDFFDRRKAFSRGLMAETIARRRLARDTSPITLSEVYQFIRGT